MRWLRVSQRGISLRPVSRQRIGSIQESSGSKRTMLGPLAGTAGRDCCAGKLSLPKARTSRCWNRLRAARSVRNATVARMTNPKTRTAVPPHSSRVFGMIMAERASAELAADRLHHRVLEPVIGDALDASRADAAGLEHAGELAVRG